MPNQQLVDYIKKSRELGHSDEGAKALLLNAGHKEEDVRAAFDAADGKNVVPTPPPPPLPPPPPPPSYSSYGDSSAELPGPTVLLSNAWQIYRARFWSLFFLSIVPILAFWALLLFGLGLTTFSALPPVVTASIFLLLVIPVVVVSIKSAVALMFSVATSRPIGLFEAFRVSKGKALSFFWASLLVSLVILGGFVMLIVPGIIFIAWFSLAQFVFVVEGHKGFNALLRSKEYVVGNWGKVFLRLLLIAIISILIPFVITFSISPVSESAARIVSGLFSSFFAPLWFTYIFSLYQTLRARRPELTSQPVSGKKGFLIFSAILGPIALIALPIAITIYVLNPSGMLADSRDVQRISDLSNLDSMISLYQATTDGVLSCVPGNVYDSRDSTTAVDGTGWLPIDFTKTPGGSPISELRIDPSNDLSYFYTYACDPVNSRFELNARLEGDKFKQKAMEDGGNNPDVYENGTNLNLIK